MGLQRCILRVTSPASGIRWLFAAHTFTVVGLIFKLGRRFNPAFVMRLMEAPLSNNTFIRTFWILMKKTGKCDSLYECLSCLIRCLVWLWWWDGALFSMG